MLDLCWIFKTHDSLCKKIVGVLCFIQWLETWTWVNCPGYGCWLNCPEISIFMHFHHPCLPDIASFEMFLHDSFQGFETKVFFKLRNPPKINTNMYHDLPPTVAMFGMKSSGWWFEHEFYDFPYIGNLIIPTDEFIFFRGVGQPPTSHLIQSSQDALQASTPPQWTWPWPWQQGNPWVSCWRFPKSWGYPQPSSIFAWDFPL